MPRPLTTLRSCIVTIAVAAVILTTCRELPGLRQQGLLRWDLHRSRRDLAAALQVPIPADPTESWADGHGQLRRGASRQELIQALRQRRAVQFTQDFYANALRVDEGKWEDSRLAHRRDPITLGCLLLSGLVASGLVCAVPILGIRGISRWCGSRRRSVV